MTRALVAVFKSQVMAEVDRRHLTNEEAARSLRDLSLHFAGKARISVDALLSEVSGRSEKVEAPHE